MAEYYQKKKTKKNKYLMQPMLVPVGAQPVAYPTPIMNQPQPVYPIQPQPVYPMQPQPYQMPPVKTGNPVITVPIGPPIPVTQNVVAPPVMPVQPVVAPTPPPPQVIAQPVLAKPNKPKTIIIKRYYEKDDCCCNIL